MSPRRTIARYYLSTNFCVCHLENPLGAYDLQPQHQLSQSYYQAGPQLTAPGSGVPPSPAGLYSSTSLNGSIAAPPVLNSMAMGMNGLAMNSMGLNGMNGLNGQMQQQSSPLIGYSHPQLNGNSPQNMSGMMQPPSPNTAALTHQQLFANAQQQQQLAQQQQQQQQSQTTPSPSQQQQFLQQQQMNLLSGGMGLGAGGGMNMMPGMFGAMPMGLPFGFSQMAFPQVRFSFPPPVDSFALLMLRPPPASSDEWPNDEPHPSSGSGCGG